jgi:hypothetical protein
MSLGTVLTRNFRAPASLPFYSLTYHWLMSIIGNARAFLEWNDAGQPSAVGSVFLQLLLGCVWWICIDSTEIKFLDYMAKWMSGSLQTFYVQIL